MLCRGNIIQTIPRIEKIVTAKHSDKHNAPERSERLGGTAYIFMLFSVAFILSLFLVESSPFLFGAFKQQLAV